jgi:hypothetical protein
MKHLVPLTSPAVSLVPLVVCTPWRGRRRVIPVG